MEIRRALKKDCEEINRLLYQVHKVHSDKRPDIFRPGNKKYTDAELREILEDDRTPIFVAIQEECLVGYAFCVFQEHKGEKSLSDIKTIYIDDLCVDEKKRGQHIGRSLYEYVLSFAKENGCYNVTLNVWACNTDAMRFYESCGLKIQKIGMEKILSE